LIRDLGGAVIYSCCKDVVSVGGRGGSVVCDIVESGVLSASCSVLLFGIILSFLVVV